MEPSSQPNDLPSPSTIGRLICCYVQQSAEQHEERAHKALNILHQKDLQLARLQEKLADLESLKLTMSQNPQESQDLPKEESRLDRAGGSTRRRDQLPAGNPDKLSRVKHTGNYTALPARQIKSNVENLSEGSTLVSSGCSEETKSQPNLQCWQKSNAHTFMRQQNVKYVPDPCAAGKVSEKIQYYERPGNGEVSSQPRIAPQNVDRRLHEGNEWRAEQCVAGIPRLDLPKSPGNDRKGLAKSGNGGPSGSNDDFVKRFLDVKLMEASIICQEMKRDAPRPNEENGKVVPDPETSVLYSMQKSRKSAMKSSSSESVDTLRSSRSRSHESLKDAAGGVPADSAPAVTEPQEPQYRRLIDHLMLYNRELKTELASVQTRAAEDREMHLSEVMKLQKCVLEMKETLSAEMSPVNGHVLVKKTKSTLFSRNVSSQTETGMFESSGVEEESSSSELHVEYEEPRGMSRTTQTDRKMSRGCFCCSLGDSEVPPQWLLAEALAHANKAKLSGGTHRHGDDPNFGGIVARVEVKDASSSTMDICTKVACTQATLTNSEAKDKTIETQANDIAALQRRIEELSQENLNLSEASRKKLEKERKIHQRIQLETERKMINFCNIVAGDVGIPSELFSSLGGEKSGDSSSGNSSRGSRKGFRMKMSARLATMGSRWDVQATRRYVKRLKAKLRVQKSKAARASEHITDLTRSLALKEQGLTTMEKCVEELLSEVTQLRAARQGPKMFAGGLEDGTGDGVYPGDKVEKQVDNSRTQNVHTRLRNVNQQLITRSRALQNLQHEMQDMQNNLQNTKNRLSKSETLNQNKQLIIENYKRRLEEIVSKEVATANRNSGLTTENHHLKDVVNNLKKQISQLHTVKCHCTAAENEAVSQKIGQKLSSEKLSSNRSEDDLRTLVDIDRIRSNLENQLETISFKLEKSEHRVAELQDSLGRFLRLAQAHFASHSRDQAASDGDASTSASRLEARTLACSILNLTHGQLESMLGSGSTRSFSGDSQLVKWLDECERLYSSDTFAEKLASFLLEILKKLSSNSRG